MAAALVMVTAVLGRGVGSHRARSFIGRSRGKGASKLGGESSSVVHTDPSDAVRHTGHPSTHPAKGQPAGCRIDAPRNANLAGRALRARPATRDTGGLEMDGGFQLNDPGSGAETPDTPETARSLTGLRPGSGDPILVLLRRERPML